MRVVLVAWIAGWCALLQACAEIPAVGTEEAAHSAWHEAIHVTARKPQPTEAGHDVFLVIEGERDKSKLTELLKAEQIPTTSITNVPINIPAR